MKDQERLLFLEAIIEAQNSIIENYADVLRRLSSHQKTTQTLCKVKEDK